MHGRGVPLGRGGVCLQGGLHPGGLGRPPRQSDTTGCGQQAGGTHPTGMHSCVYLFYKVEQIQNIQIVKVMMMALTIILRETRIPVIVIRMTT